jgi:Ca-activated chloride channel family protein
MIMKTIISFSAIVLLSMFLVSADMAQRTIRGMVSDTEGNVLVGVRVSVPGTTLGTVTDFYGTYSMAVPDHAKHIEFSLVGYKTERIRIGTSDVLNVTLTASVTEPEEHLVPVHDMVQDASVKPHLTAAERTKWDARKSAAGSAAPVMYQSTYYINGVQNVQSGDWNTEAYATIHENGFKDVMHAPLSTFSIDVDKASYSNVRRFINMGQQPPVDAVRIEEMINYFSYDYPEPEGDHPFTVSTELTVCPWNAQHQLLHIGLQGKSIEKEQLPPSNIVFLLDVSGSMGSPNKLPLLKKAFGLLVKELRPEDRVAIVVYAGAAGAVLESTPGSEKSTIMEALERLNAGGSTAGGAGLKLAYKIAGENFIEEGNNRIILATDGDFNVGASSDAEMERMIEKEREKGIFITVLGFGMGNYKDSKMEIIADKGNGNYAYIDNIQEANKVFVSEFGGTLFTIAKDVKFQLEFNPARVKGYRLVGYENRLLNDEDFNDDTKDAGEMGAGHTVTAFYEIIPAGSEEDLNGIDPLKYQSDGKRVTPDPRAELLTVKLRYKQPDGDKSVLYTKAVKGIPVQLEKTSDNVRFAASVAQFGMILRGSEYLKEGTIQDVLALARGARGEDSEGYRGEFIKLVTTSERLMAQNK